MRDIIESCVGYESGEGIAWEVCRDSLLRHASGDIEIYPLKQAALRELGLYTRSTDKASTEFSLTRFLTPYLAAHDGWTIFVDCDFLFNVDIMKVLHGASRDRAVYVVKHDYTPANTMKKWTPRFRQPIHARTGRRSFCSTTRIRSSRR